MREEKITKLLEDRRAYEEEIKDLTYKDIVIGYRSNEFVCLHNTSKHRILDEMINLAILNLESLIDEVDKKLETIYD